MSTLTNLVRIKISEKTRKDSPKLTTADWLSLAAPVALVGLVGWDAIRGSRRRTKELERLYKDLKKVDGVVERSKNVRKTIEEAFSSPISTKPYIDFPRDLNHVTKNFANTPITELHPVFRNRIDPMTAQLKFELINPKNLKVAPKAPRAQVTGISRSPSILEGTPHSSNSWSQVKKYEDLRDSVKSTQFDDLWGKMNRPAGNTGRTHVQLLTEANAPAMAAARRDHPVFGATQMALDQDRRILGEMQRVAGL